MRLRLGLALARRLDVGVAFKTRAAYQEAAQAAVRAGAMVGATDQDALNRVRTMLVGENLNNISSVTIYDATASGGIVAPMSATVPTSTTYMYDPTIGFVCNDTKLPPPCRSGWTQRNTTAQQGPLDTMGLEIDYTYRSVTGLLGPMSMKQIATALLEPTTYGASLAPGP